MSEKEPEKPEVSHAEQDCQRCITVSDIEEIFAKHTRAFVMDRWVSIREQAQVTRADMLKMQFGLLDLEDKIVEIGRFTMPGWFGHSMFYLFHCLECEELAVDHVHGHDARLVCSHCKTIYQLRSKRFYKNDDRQPPPPLWKQLFSAIRAARNAAGSGRNTRKSGE